MNKSLKKYMHSAPCFYCNVDSAELKTFLIITIGGLVLSSIFFAIGLVLRGTFKNTENLNDLPLKIEGDTNV